MPLLASSLADSPSDVPPASVHSSSRYSHYSRESSRGASIAPPHSPELDALKRSLEELHRKREEDRALLQSIADRMLCQPAVRYNVPDFIEAEEVAHLSLHERSDRAFVRILFDQISDDEEEKKLEVDNRERIKVRWVEEQFRKYRHPNPHRFASEWKGMLRQFKKTLKRREDASKATET
ncbi:hypothetical protein PMAYCL1PPCAC_22053, partial [Pristionchus mayeri]